jgi:hypothetical protein
MATTEQLDAARKISILKKYAKGEKVSDDDKKFAGIISEAKIDKTQPKVRWPTIYGAESFSGLTHAPLPLIKKIRKGGSKAFLSGNRIDSLTLICDLFDALNSGTRLPDGIATPQDWLATEKARREAIKRQQDEKSVMPTAEVVRQAGEAGGVFMASLERMARELPPALAGCSVTAVAARMETEIENVRRILKVKMAEIGE